jgi:hypothetical protein
MSDLLKNLDAIYNSWSEEYIKEDDEWVKKVNNNPFIAIESHINEDTITEINFTKAILSI